MRNLTFAFAVLLSACAPQLISTRIATTEPTAAATSTSTPTLVAGWWQPAVGSSWQIQFTGDVIDTTLDVDVYDLDLFDSDADVVAGLQARGVGVMCYINVGAWEDWRPDVNDFPSEVVGNDYEGWPGERWLDVSNIAALAPVMEARLDLCAQKGFTGVDPDNLDGYLQETGFEITREDQLGYLLWLAREAHERGLAIGLKNAPELAGELAATYDWALTESCFAQGWCEDVLIFVERGKAVFAIEYVEEGMTLADFCEQAAALEFSAILKTLELDAWVEIC